jgi:phage shock protein E
MRAFGIFLTFVFASAGCTSQDNGVKTLNQANLSSKLQEENVVLIDVRTTAAVTSGYLPETRFFLDVNHAEFDQQISELDTSKIYIMYCRSGARSSQAVNQLMKKGVKNVYNLEGGILSYRGKLRQ